MSSVRVSVLHSSNGSLQEGEQYGCTLIDDQAGLKLVPQSQGNSPILLTCNQKIETMELGKNKYIIKPTSDDGVCYILSFNDDQQGASFCERMRRWNEENVFDQRTEKSSSDMYFHYYGLLMHQQNMMQDLQRTGMYYWAVASNINDFAGKFVMDVGAGSGILSAFAAQAGAKKVYAVEASQMAKYCATLLKQQIYGSCIEVINKKLEEIEVCEDAENAGDISKVDVLISEPMGTLLVNERMLETYITARKRFLKEGGKMYPNVGQLFAALFQDDMLYMEMANKAVFWCNQNFFGVDLSPLHADALDTYFRQVVIDSFNPGILLCGFVSKDFDFVTLDERDLHKIDFPFEFEVQRNCVVHGIACWFDVLFQGSQFTKVLSTAPGLAPTHWHQMRFVLKEPIYIKEPSKICGCLQMVAHERQSYDITLHLSRYSLFHLQNTEANPTPSEVRTAQYDLKDPYYRQFQATWYGQNTQEQQPHPNVENNNNHNQQTGQQQFQNNGGGQQQQNGMDSLQDFMVMEEQCAVLNGVEIQQTDSNAKQQQDVYQLSQK